MADQRQVRRHPESILRVTFERPTGGERAAVVAWDASLGGMFLETEAPLDEGALVTLEIRTAETTVSVDSRVLWARPSKVADDQPAGMAVRFIDLPDDVSVALNRALQSAMHDKTILGVGGVSKEPTQIGLAAPPGAPGPVPRETQIGVAPPANEALTPPTPVISPVAAKPQLVLSETSLAETPAPPARGANEKKFVDPARLEETAPSRARFTAKDGEAPVRQKSSVAGRLVLLLLLGAAAAGLYLYRGPITDRFAPPAPAPSAAPTSSASLQPTASPVDAAASTAHDDAAATSSSPPSDAGLDASHDDAKADAGRLDAGARDGGARDGGAVRDAGHDAGKSPRAAPKHSN